MKPGACLLILCALLPASLAEDMALRSGRVLKDASVVSSGDDFVSVQYTDGVAKVSYKELTDEQQKAYSDGARKLSAGKGRKRSKKRLRKRPGKSVNPSRKRNAIHATWRGRTLSACSC